MTADENKENEFKMPGYQDVMSLNKFNYKL